MTEPIDVAIQAALCERLTSVDLGYPIAWPLVKYVPTPETPYLEVHPVLRAAPDNPYLGFADSAILRGVFQVDAVTTLKNGEAAGLRMAAAVVARFARGTVLTANSLRVQILMTPNIAPVVMDAPWARFPVSIPYVLIT